MVRLLRRQEAEPRAVESRAVELPVIGVAPRLARRRGEEYGARSLVERDEVAHHPRALRDAAPHLAARVEVIQVSPPVALGVAHNAPVAEHADVRARAE